MQADRLDQQEAKPPLRGEHLAEQRADQREREADADAGEDFGDRGRQQHIGGDLRRRHAHHPRGSRVDRIEVAHRGKRQDRDRHDAMEGAEGNLGRHADAEGEQHDRVQCDLRDGIERDQHRLADFAGEAIEPEREPDQDAERDRDGERDREGLSRLCEMWIECGRAEKLNRVADRIERGGQ